MLTKKLKDLMDLLGFPVGSKDKESACSAGDLGLREWLPTVIFMPEEFHGQRSLEGYSPWGHKQSDTTGQLILSPGNQGEMAENGPVFRDSCF